MNIINDHQNNEPRSFGEVSLNILKNLYIYIFFFYSGR